MGNSPGRESLACGAPGDGTVFVVTRSCTSRNDCFYKDYLRLQRLLLNSQQVKMEMDVRPFASCLLV